MKSYIYIVITKELFRQSIAGIERGSAGGGSAACPSPLPLIPPEQDFCGITSPRASCRGAAGADALCLGAELGTARAPDPPRVPAAAPSIPHPGGPGPPGRDGTLGSRRSRGRSCTSGPGPAAGPPLPPLSLPHEGSEPLLRRHYLTSHRYQPGSPRYPCVRSTS